jgi:ABC-type transport system involved in Fe-S cluster assembly fused permease/ATPase subunit
MFIVDRSICEICVAWNCRVSSFNMKVGEHGIQLSRGEKQCVAIAMAILKNPRISLLNKGKY